MSRAFLVIDGYNLMHAGGIARRTYGPGQLERCRSRLLRHLARHLSAPERERTTIVFDAMTAPADLCRRTTYEGMAVCFASPGKEADDAIEEIIASHSAPRQIRLVSSDHRLQRSVRKRRGKFVDSEDFIEEIDHRPLVSSSQDGQQPPPDAASAKATDIDRDTEEWLRIFGDVPQAPGAEDRQIPMSQADVAALQAEIDRQEVRPRSRAARRRSRKDA